MVRPAASRLRSPPAPTYPPRPTEDPGMRAAWPLLALGLTCPTSLVAEQPTLPPTPAWDGASRALVRPGDPWITPAEASSFRRTPSYDETVAWLRRLEAAAPQVRLVSI